MTPRQAAEVADVQDNVGHAPPPALAVGVPSLAPKCKPERVIMAETVAAALRSGVADTTGASYV